ncbi:hypothetical protein J3Q64DRAFT_1778979 [Phycomyces blakesleeanus]|uniref:Helicase ATP-binding domain-containing protein n=1 Tax=Phycomyces blakesleeanus TaxID=4837 RepID=A0ABR3AGT7_PHYBL
MAPQIISSICEGCHTITQSDIHWQSTSDTNSINNHNNNTNNPTTDDENEDEGEDEDEDKNEDQDQDEDQDEDEDKEENEDKGEDEDEDEDEDKDKAKDKANANTKKLILSQNEEYLTFRCSQCKCNYHYNCLPCFPDALSRFNELPGKEIVEEMCLAEWKCAYCITYDKKIESVITWRPMRTNLGTPAQGYQPNKTQFREFLVKWKTMSFRHLTWVPATWLARVEPSLYRDACKFDFVRPPLSEQTLVPRSWMMIESILDIEHFQIQGRYVISRVFAKFCNLPYDEACWDTPPPDYSDLYPAYRRALYQWERVRRIKTPHDLEKRILAIRSVQTDKDFPNHQLKIEPDYITGGRLLKHQLGDINWLLQQWLLNKLYVHVDNSGFGKTIQTIIFLYHLFKKFDIYPFAIVVSESSLTKWLDAFKKWAPDLSVAGYYGSEASCRTASEYEIFRTGSSASASASASSSVGAGAGAGAAQGGRSGIKCHAVLFTHKSLTSDPAEIISRVDYWAACVIDESQQLIDFTNHEKPTFNITRCNQYITIVGTSLESHARKLSIQSS